MHATSYRNQRLPAPKSGGLYKTNCHADFVAAIPSRVFRDGMGTLFYWKSIVITVT